MRGYLKGNTGRYIVIIIQIYLRILIYTPFMFHELWTIVQSQMSSYVFYRQLYWCSINTHNIGNSYYYKPKIHSNLLVRNMCNLQYSRNT